MRDRTLKEKYGSNNCEHRPLLQQLELKAKTCAIVYWTNAGFLIQMLKDAEPAAFSKSMGLV
jgi:hypothetical protein